VTNYRRNKAKIIGKINCKHLHTPEVKSKGLRSREWWKYKKLHSYLEGKYVKHIFEFPLDNYVFDLALVDKKILVEFDGPYHNSRQQQNLDEEKNQIAKEHGWKIFRIPLLSEKILPEKLSGRFV